MGLMSETALAGAAFFEGLQTDEEASKLWDDFFVLDRDAENSINENSQSGGPNREELEVLVRSIFLIFFIVAAADGKFEKKELKAFMKILKKPEKFHNPLITEICRLIGDDAGECIEQLANEKIDFIDELSNLKSVIEESLPEQNANEFKLALLAVGNEIAKSTSGILGFGKTVGTEEQAALGTIVGCLGVTLL
jgi:uncharacterized tellurite resistance protein B-like protein